MKDGKKRIKKILIFFSLFLIILLNGHRTTSFADGSSFQVPSFMGRTEVYKGSDNYSPIKNEYPFNQSNMKSIGFNFLFDDSKNLIEYMGEIPKNKVDSEEDEGYRYFDGTTIDGIQRLFSSNDSVLISEEESTDPRITSMKKSHSFFNFSQILYWISNFFNSITAFFVNLMIKAKSLDLATILNSIDSSGQLSKALSSIFLINPDTGKMSPFLTFSLVLFIISLVSLAIKCWKADRSIKQLFNEIGYFIAALVFVGLFLTSTNVLKIGVTGMNFLNAFSNEFLTLDDASMKIFVTKSDTLSNEDIVSTQQSLIKKAYIDQIIYAQFGYPVEELDLGFISDDVGGVYDLNFSGNSFGDANKVRQAVLQTFGNLTGSEFIICTSSSGSGNRIRNLGYYLWAANTNVKTSRYGGFTTGSDGVRLENGTTDRILFVIDFLSNLRNLYEADGSNPEMIEKIDTIMLNLQKPQYGTASWKVFTLSLLNLSICWALISIVIFCLLGELIVVFGGFACVILPPLFLFPKTRNFAKKIIWTYGFGYIRFLVGCALFNTVIIVSVLLSKQDLPGVLLAILINFLLGKFGPTLIGELNAQLENAIRGKQLNFVSRTNSKINNKLLGYNREQKYKRMQKRKAKSNKNPAKGRSKGNSSDLKQNYQDMIDRNTNAEDYELLTKSSESRIDNADSLLGEEKIVHSNKDVNNTTSSNEKRENSDNNKNSQVGINVNISKELDDNIDNDGDDNKVQDYKNQDNIKNSINNVEDKKENENLKIDNGNSDNNTNNDKVENVKNKIKLNENIRKTNGEINKTIEKKEESDSTTNIKLNNINEKLDDVNKHIDKNQKEVVTNVINKEKKEIYNGIRNNEIDQKQEEIKTIKQMQKELNKDYKKEQKKEEKKEDFRNKITSTASKVPVVGNKLSKTIRNSMEDKDERLKLEKERLINGITQEAKNFSAQNQTATLHDSYSSYKNRVLSSINDSSQKKKVEKELDRNYKDLSRLDIKKIKDDLSGL